MGEELKLDYNLKRKYFIPFVGLHKYLKENPSPTLKLFDGFNWKDELKDMRNKVVLGFYNLELFAFTGTGIILGINELTHGNLENLIK
ncbi:MAG: hypothetical protein WC812_03335 [Candidatus Pacearchaeota archaeon]|jgi:hypothetical protein